MSQHRRYVMRMMLQMKLLNVMLLQLSRFHRILLRVGVDWRISYPAAGGEPSVGGVKTQQRRCRIVKHTGGRKTRQWAGRDDVERKTMRRRRQRAVMMMMVTQMAQRVGRVRVCGAGSGAGSDAAAVGRRDRSAAGQIRESEADVRRRCQEARQRGKLRRGGRKEGMNGGGNDDVARRLGR